MPYSCTYWPFHCCPLEVQLVAVVQLLLWTIHQSPLTSSIIGNGSLQDHGWPLSWIWFHLNYTHNNNHWQKIFFFSAGPEQWQWQGVENKVGVSNQVSSKCIQWSNPLTQSLNTFKKCISMLHSLLNSESLKVLQLSFIWFHFFFPTASSMISHPPTSFPWSYNICQQKRLNAISRDT